jgi:dipeptidase E
MLISNSFSHGKGYLEHCVEDIKLFLGSTRTVTFIPFAQHDWATTEKVAMEGLKKFDITVRVITDYCQGLALAGRIPAATMRAVLDAEALLVGGGNTFRLLEGLQRWGLLDIIRQRVDRGAPYIGVSAGANIAGPTIMTTNDMPIVYPQGFGALNFFPYQINPHFVDADPASRHMGETREKRIGEFHEEHDTPVVGIREGSWVTMEMGTAWIGGQTFAKIFRKGESPKEWDSGPLNVFS